MHDRATGRGPPCRGMLWALASGLACAGGDAASSSTTIASSVGSTASATTAATEDAESTTGGGDSEGATATSTDPDATSTPPDTSATDTGPCEETTWYFDGDGDGRGDPSMTIQACDAPPSYVPFGDDCDDADPTQSVAADEICDGADNDCDDAIDEASASNTACNGCTLFAVALRSYAFCPAGASWDSARTQCAAFGGDLLRLDDETESGAVVALPEPASVVGGGWFIGLSDVAARGTFVWVDGGALEFASWLGGEPNDAGGNEDCAEMDQAGGGWNDLPCEGPRAFICESAAP